MFIAESTRKLLGNLFELEDLGAQDLKGIAEPVRAWAALRASSAEGRFDAFHASGLTGPHRQGRRTRLAAETVVKGKDRRRRGSVAIRRAGHWQVSIDGGAIGAASSLKTHTRACVISAPRSTRTAGVYPIISQMERAAGFAHDDAGQTKLDKLDALLAQSFTPIREVALFAEMLSLRNIDHLHTIRPSISFLLYLLSK